MQSSDDEIGQQHAGQSSNSTKVSLDLRGQRLSLEREALMELPESVLLCLFPNGVVLSPQRQPRLDGGGNGDGQDDQEEEEDVYFVDFDAQCLEFVLNFFGQARDEFYGVPGGPQRDLSESQPHAQQANMSNPLFLKQAIIVLREELEYFAIPPKCNRNPADRDNQAVNEAGPAQADLGDSETPGTDENGKPNQALLKLKIDCGNALLERKSIFTALQRNVNRENNVAEQHLIDMLCVSGFERDDVWGYRSLEPNRCCIASIALVLLKTGITHPPITVAEGQEKPPMDVNAMQLATAQKLLLFWRKPARKCWWDATEVTLDGKETRVWSRRVWTLELSLL